MKRYVLIVCSLFLGINSYSQLSINALDSIASLEPKLNEIVDLNVYNVSLPEFLKSLGLSHGLNFFIEDKVSGNVRNSFSNVKVKDVLSFVIQEFDLDIFLSGNIFIFKKRQIRVVSKKPKELLIMYDTLRNEVSIDLKNDTLIDVVKKLSLLTRKAVICAPEIRLNTVTFFVDSKPLQISLEMLAAANNLKINNSNEGYLLIEQNLNEPNSPIKKIGEKSEPKIKTEIKLQKSTNGCLEYFIAKEVSLKSSLEHLSSTFDLGLIFLDEVKGNVDIQTPFICLDQLLELMLINTEFSFYIKDSLLVIGNQKREILRISEVIKMNYRPSESVLDIIPMELKENVEIKIFKDLNALVLTGSAQKVENLRKFISLIDEVVPMVIIEVLIMDVKKIAVVSTGVSAGLGSPPTSTNGSITPGLNLSLSTSAINDLISGINGFGVLNLGNVTPEFYLNLQALEENGSIKIRSTPKLSTLNGHEATLKIGNTEYYLEISNNVIGTQNPQNIITQVYKSVNADLSLVIRPVVSADQNVTLEIEIEQSDFTGRIAANAPPGSVTRNFKSSVRVRNGETILLGGLEEKNNNLTYSGLPGIAKIPFLRWLFGKRTMDKSTSKLNIFIKPTIVY